MTCNSTNLDLITKLKTVSDLIEQGQLGFDSSEWVDPNGNLTVDDNTLQKVLDKLNLLDTKDYELTQEDRSILTKVTYMANFVKLLEGKENLQDILNILDNLSLSDIENIQAGKIPKGNTDGTDIIWVDPEHSASVEWGSIFGNIKNQGDLVHQLTSINNSVESVATTESVKDAVNFAGSEKEVISIFLDAEDENKQAYIKDKNGEKTSSLLDSGLVSVSYGPQDMMGAKGKYIPHNLVDTDLLSSLWDKTNISLQEYVGGYKVTVTDISSDPTLRLHSHNAFFLKVGQSFTTSFSVKTTQPTIKIGTLSYSNVEDLVEIQLDTLTYTPTNNNIKEVYIEQEDDGFIKISISLEYFEYFKPFLLFNNTLDATYYIRHPQVHAGYEPLQYVKDTGVNIEEDEDGKKYLKLSEVGYCELLWSNDITKTEWVKTNIVATYGVDGCMDYGTNIIASDNNASFFQSFSTTYDAGKAYIYVRRVIGTGKVYFSADGGTTKTDITDQLTDKYKLFSIDAPTNPNIGLILLTSGDAVDVSVCTYVKSDMDMPVIPTYDTSKRFGGCSLNIDETKFSFSGTGGVLFCATKPTVNLNTYQNYKFINIKDDTYFQGFYHQNYIAQNKNVFNIYQNVGVFNTITAASYVNGVQELTIKTVGKENFGGFTGNGNVIIPVYSENQFVPNKIEISNKQKINKLIWTNRDIPFDDVRYFRDSNRRTKEGIFDIVTLGKAREDVTIDRLREPNIFVLDTTDTYTKLRVVYSQKLYNSSDNEYPARLVHRDVTFNKETKKFENIEPFIVFNEPIDWGDYSVTSFTQSPCFIRIPRGVHKGRIVVIYSDSTTSSLNPRTMFKTYSDDNGETWSDKVELFSVSGNEYNITDPAGTYVILPEDHPTNPNRILITNYAKIVYSDDWGETWTMTNQVFTDVSETNICLSGNGYNIYVTGRIDNSTIGVHKRKVYKSSDGETWVEVGFIENYDSTNRSYGLLQRSFIKSPFGEILVGGSEGARGHRIYKVDSEFAASGFYEVLDSSFDGGYSSFIEVDGIIFFTHEGLAGGNDIKSSIYLYAINEKYI